MKRANTGVLARWASCSFCRRPSARVCTTAGLREVQGNTSSPTHGLMAIRSRRWRSLLCRVCPWRCCPRLMVLCHGCCTWGLATPWPLGPALRGRLSRCRCLGFSFSIQLQAAGLVLSTCGTVSRGTFSRHFPLSCAGPSELGRRVSATRRWPLPIWPVLWALEGPCAQPASSTAAEVTGQASPLPLWATLVSSGEPEEAAGCSGQPPAPCLPGSLVPCLAGTHRSMSGTGHPADGSTGLPSTACGASSGSGSESALLSGLLLSSLLELHRRLRGRRRPRHRRRRFLAMIFHLLRHWEPVRWGSSEAIFAQ